METSDVYSWNSIHLALEVQVLIPGFLSSWLPKILLSFVQQWRHLCKGIKSMAGQFGIWGMTTRKMLDHDNTNSDFNFKGERDRLLVDESRYHCLRGFSDQRWMPSFLLRFDNCLSAAVKIITITLFIHGLMVSFAEGGSSLSWTYFLSSAGGRLGIIEGHWTLALNTLEYKWRKKQPHAENDQSKPLLDNDQKCQKLTPYPKSTENWSQWSTC